MINTAIQSTDKNVLVVFPVWQHHLQNVNKSSYVHFQTLLRQFAHFLIFHDIQVGLIIIKDRRRTVYFNNQTKIAFDLSVEEQW